MRASYINKQDVLTPLGNWIAERLPHIESHRGIWGDPKSRVFRIFALKPYYRFCLFDYTKWDASAGQTKGPWYRVRLLGWTVYEGRPSKKGKPVQFVR